MFIDFFIRRPIFATVCSLIILLSGLIVMGTLPIAQYPEIAPPQVTVSSTYIGANAQVVESAVTTPLEQEINGVEGMKYMTSTSTNDGVSTINITFNTDRNLDAAVVDVKNRVSVAEARLPAEVKATGVNISKNSTAMVLVYGLYSQKGEYDNYFISNYADRYIKDTLKRVNGVGTVTIFGERKYAMRLWLDPRRLAARKLTASDVVASLLDQNVQVAAGQVGQPPQDTNQSYQMSVKADGRLSSPEEFKNLILKNGANGSMVRLKDVGRVELGAESYSSSLRFNGQNAVGIGVFQLPKANALDVAAKVKTEMARLEKSFPPGMKAQLALDTTTVISESLKEVVITLGIAILLVVAVIFLFLQNWRSTLVPAITIPVSLIGTFVFMKMFGFSINTLTLFGLTLATGLVVDDAIIVIENIERFIQEKGMSPFEAASAAMQEVSGAVIATSLVLIAVFVPVAFYPGTTGILYQQFAMTIAFSIALSAFNALTFTPSISARILQAAAGHHITTGFWGGVNRVIDWIRSTYSNMLKHVMAAPAVVLVVFVALLGVTFWLMKTVPGGFVPNEDQGYFITTVQSPEGSSLGYTEKVIDQISTKLAKMPDVMGVFAVGGYSPMGSGPNKGTLFVTLAPLEKRKRHEQAARSLMGQAQGQFFANPNAMIFAFEPPAIRGVGSLGGFQFEVLDKGSHELNTLFTTTQDVIGNGRKDPGLAGLFSSFTANDPQLKVSVDREKAKSLQVPLQQIYSTMQVFLGSVYVNDFDFLNRIYRVYVQADQPFRANPQSIGSYYVRSNATGNPMIPLSNLVKVSQLYTPQVINHYNLFRSTEINGAASPGHSTGEAIQSMEKLAKNSLPDGMGFEWSGIALEQLQSSQQAIFIFILSFMFVFLVLAAQYESFLDPFIILLAVPLAIFGALGAQMFRGLENDVFCQIGLVMLIGLASKNAILIVEFANQQRKLGKSIPDAAFIAAKTRFRPILMTSLAFILGIVPLMVAEGAGSASRHSMGTAVFGGMVVSTILNLFIVPVFYILSSTARERLFRNKKAQA